MQAREWIAKRVAMELKDGDFVNLGIGMPTMVADYIPENVQIMLEAENGILGVGPTSDENSQSDDCIDAGGNYVTTVKGAAFFDSFMSFSIIRGSHIDVTVLGALEVDQDGNLASWMVPGKKVTGMGGAMDLVCGAKKVIVSMIHRAKNGTSKIVEKCTLPLTAINVVDMIVTDLGVFDVVQSKGIAIRELAPGVTLDEVIKSTDAKLIVPDNL